MEKKFRQKNSICMLDIIKTYGPDGNMSFDECTELNIYRWATKNKININCIYFCSKLDSALDELKIDSSPAKVWLSENTPYYEEVLPNNIVRMWKMEPGQTGVIIADHEDNGDFCIAGHDPDGMLCVTNLKSGRIYTEKSWSWEDNKVRLCDLDIRGKVKKYNNETPW